MLTCSCSLFLSIVTLISGVRGHNQRIETFLTAKWKSTSPLSEAAEFISDIDPVLFWKFLDNIFDKQESFPLTSTNDDNEADMASVSAFNLISPAKLRLMEWSMTSRAYSPRVHMLQELAPSFDLIPEGCKTFVQYGENKISCNLQELEEVLTLGKIDENEFSIITEQDHKFPSYIWNIANPPILILYGHPSILNTKKFHEFLKSKSDEFGYIYRPYKPGNETLLIAGYGAELQFKSTEYVAQDDTGKSTKTEEVGGFIFEKLHELHPELSENLEKFQNHLTSERGKQAGFEALKAWQVQELGLQASYFTTLQDNVLESLLDISGNFPSRAGSLSSVRVPNDFKKSLSNNQRILLSHFNLDEGEGSFFLQGNLVDPDSLDLFGFMDSLHTELDLMESLRSIYHDFPQTRTRLNSYLQIGSRSSSDPDLALDIRDSSIYWINDLEKDEEYEDWPDDLTQLFFRMGGIMLRPVRRNVFNLLFSLNPEDNETTEALLKLAQSFMAHKAPLRVGVIFCSGASEMPNSIEDEIPDIQNGEVIRRIMNHAVTEGKIKRTFGSIVDAYDRKDRTKLLKLFNETGEEFDFGGELACDFVRKSGRPPPGAFLNGIPLKWDNIDDFEEIVLNQLLREAQVIQSEAYTGKVNDRTDIFEYIMNKPNIQTRLNDKILDTTNAKYIPFGNEIWEPGKDQKNPAAALASRLNYIIPSSKRNYPVSISQWVLADITTPDGHLFLQNAVEFLQESSTHSRIAFIPTDTKKSAFKTRVIEAIAQNEFKQLLRLLRDSKHVDENDNEEQPDQYIDNFLKLIGFAKESKGVILNGRVIGPLKAEESFDLGDWALAEKFSYDSCAKHFDDNGNADIPMRVCSLMSSPKIKAKNSKRFTSLEFESPIIANLPKDEQGDPYYLDIKAVVDPASRHAHKMAAIMTAVSDTLSQWTRIEIIYNPPSKHSELPLKSYFRYIAGNNPVEKITFEQIPREPLFTQNFIAPDNWMVEVVKGVNDLDNIRLRDLEGSVTSEFELANLLVEGHCLELKSGSPPRGVQFTLTPSADGIKPAETIVMANLGYFQLKAHPGVWKLNLRDGPSNEIFSLDASNMNPIGVHSFQSVVVKVKVKRNPGKETVSLLDSEEESNAGWFGFGGTKKEMEDDTINVFSLASGHLYERLLKIMMLSVLKNTKSKVKFWFIKNYLSPTIKNVLPDMAKEYGFEYELVQYHWPRWLNPQREKQRIIWGYKILFLDVLFPLSLKKIVFVDADQIVRTDLKELFDLDLEGNPYGYTPFCDSRKEMDGFRFWNQGYWRTHLGKRKYHISALYVVDLVRFRKVAAGDRLRGQYQALSQDPNSLSNLDQDLPNNMIHQVGIKSLPQEWLWCETWCDDASKSKAKTIDLCNNPQTKESKLDAAQRIVPEWKEYDQELREFQNRLQQRVEVHDEL